SLCRDGQRQHHSSGGNRAGLQGQLLPVQRAAHEPGRTDPLTTSWVWRHRDRLAVLAGLAGITVAAWVNIVVTARRMATDSADMTGPSMAPMMDAMTGVQPWTAT